MIKIAICDDDSYWVDIIEKEIINSKKHINGELEIDVYYTASKFKTAITSMQEYDLVYMDLELGDDSGIELGKFARKYLDEVLIIYVSNHDEYMINLFEAYAFRYIPKPISSNKFTNYLCQAVEELNDTNQSFIYSYKKEIHRINICNIIYFESAKRVIRTHEVKTIDEFYGKLDDVESKLVLYSRCEFYRIHQSYLINYNFIKKIGKENVELTDGTVLPISTNKGKSFKLAIGNKMKSEVVYM